MTILKGFIFSGIILTATLCGAKELSSEQLCDFDCTLQTHLDAIKQKDFDQFEKTITPRKRMSFILPNGKYFDDPQAFREMLKGWFEQGGWTFEYTLVSKHSSDTLGHALLLVDYNEADRNGKPYHIDHYLSLIFEKQGSHWYLVHDQNTKTELKKEKTAP